MPDPKKPVNLVTMSHPGCGFALILATILFIGTSLILMMFLYEW